MKERLPLQTYLLTRFQMSRNFLTLICGLSVFLFCNVGFSATVIVNFSGSVTSADSGNALRLSVGGVITGSATYDDTLLTGSGAEFIGLGTAGSGFGGTLTMNMGTVSFFESEDDDFSLDIYPELQCYNGALVGFDFIVYNKPNVGDFFVVSGASWNFVGRNSSLVASGTWETFSEPHPIPEYSKYSTVLLDIKPQSCPNPLNVKSKGVLPVAILGTANFDVNDIVFSSIELEGVSPIRSGIEDVAAPVANRQDDCDCTTDGPDGFDDLTLKFDTQAIVVALESALEPLELEDGDEIPLMLTVTLLDGTEIEGFDCVIIKKKGK